MGPRLFRHGKVVMRVLVVGPYHVFGDNQVVQDQGSGGTRIIYFECLIMCMDLDRNFRDIIGRLDRIERSLKDISDLKRQLEKIERLLTDIARRR